MLLYYIRHGFPTYHPDCLTPLGHRQAESVCRRLSVNGIDRIFASTSQRAKETAQPLCEILGKEMELVDFANEKYAAEYFVIDGVDGYLGWAAGDKKLRHSFFKPEVRAMGRDWYNHPDFEGYGFDKGINRAEKQIDEFLESLGYRHNREKGYFEVINPNNDRVALFAHAGFGQLFASTVLDIPYPDITMKFSMNHTGMTVFNFKDEDGICIPNVLMYSGDGHLYKDSLPTDYIGQGPKI